MANRRYDRQAHRFDIALSYIREIDDAVWNVERWRTRKELQALLHRVWKKYGRRDMPDGPDLEFQKGPGSECIGRKTIIMIPEQQNYSILLHEIVHALGYEHGPAFMHKFINLMCEYGGCDRDMLMLQATMLGVKT
jgi:hypothetical protein